MSVSENVKRKKGEGDSEKVRKSIKRYEKVIAKMDHKIEELAVNPKDLR